MSVLPIDIRPKDWGILRDILGRQMPGREVWAFGSRARGTAKPFSDLDIAIVTDAPLPLEEIGALKDALTESELPFRVDIVDWACTDAAFRKIIEKDRVVVQSSSTPAN